jgi:hypothetical protein
LLVLPILTLLHGLELAETTAQLFLLTLATLDLALDEIPRDGIRVAVAGEQPFL